MNKIKIALGFASTCGGSELALSNVGSKLIELSEIAEIVSLPVPTRENIETVGEQSDIDVAIFFGSLRTRDHEIFLKTLRDKSDMLIAFGTCACYGGIPGLANIATKESLLKTAYSRVSNTEAPNGIPGLEPLEREEITLPTLKNFVSAPAEVVDFDILLPGCPPPTESVEKMINIIKDHQNGLKVPKHSIIAEEKSLCNYCPREKPENISLEEIKRSFTGKINENECFLKQGIPCLGPITRGGCGALCIKKNQPCMGCFGPVPGVKDQGTEFFSHISTAIMLGKEEEIGEKKLRQAIDKNITDPVGLFYRFTLSAATINRKYSDKED